MLGENWMLNAWRRNFTSEKCKDCNRSLAQTRDGLCDTCLQRRLDNDYPCPKRHPIRESADRHTIQLKKESE